jgi:peptidyl-prolyl cis-trans isomerase B (cyclophilin B)
MKKFLILVFFLSVALSGWSQKAVAQVAKGHDGVTLSMNTTEGEIVIQLYDETPLHRDNFVKLVHEHVYDGLLFHRVIKNFMIQGGDPKSRDAKPGQALGDGSLGYTIPAEIRKGLYHKRGALCAARQGDDVNPRRESSASQFYIVQGQVWDNAILDRMQERFGKTFTEEQRRLYTTVGGTPHLDGEYTVFGEVVKGMDVVDRITALECDRMDRPVKDVRIISIKILK